MTRTSPVRSGSRLPRMCPGSCPTQPGSLARVYVRFRDFCRQPIGRYQVGMILFDPLVRFYLPIVQR